MPAVPYAQFSNNTPPTNANNEGESTTKSQIVNISTDSNHQKSPTFFHGYQSLSPRTRLTIKAFGAAAVLALAILAIFHIAKLAAYSDDEIDQTKESIRLSKNRGGKAYVLPGELEPTDDLQHLGGRPGVVMHPILGVPVPTDFLEKDLQRLQKLAEAKERPANVSEVEETLEIVQRRVAADSKKFTGEDLANWQPGDTPLRILLATTWRSGSTFLGQVLASHPAVFLHYEPLSGGGIKQLRSGKAALQAQQFLHHLFDCRFQGLDDYLNYTKLNEEDMIGHNLPIWESCKAGPNRNACFNETFLSRACQMFPIQLMKTVRMRLNLTQLFLHDEKYNVKVIFLVRDPRAVMSSRYSSVTWCAESPDCASPEVLCNDMQNDLKTASVLSQLYPDRFFKVRYEDLASDTQTQVERLFRFLGLEYSPELVQYVNQQTSADMDTPWSIQRKSSDRVELWKKQLPLEEIHNIQNACEGVLNTLGYEMLEQ